jgi:hypothetical protein
MTAADVVREVLVGSSQHPVRDHMSAAIVAILIGLSLSEIVNGGGAALIGIVTGTLIGSILAQRRRGRGWKARIAAAAAETGRIAALLLLWWASAEVMNWPPGASPAARLAQSLGVPVEGIGAVVVIGLLWYAVYRQFTPARRIEAPRQA